MPVEVNCKKCDKVFYAKNSEIKRGNGKFCSRSCSSQSYRKEGTSSKVKLKCAKCNIIFYARKRETVSGLRFCGNSCRQEAQRMKMFSWGIKDTKPKKKCLSCNNETKSKTRYCQNCKSVIILQTWLKGSHFENGSDYIPSVIRKHLLSESKDKCLKCGWGERNPKSGKIPLAIDHIDGNAFNHSLNNLRVLCPNCHSLTPTYGILNAGNGKRNRKI